MSHSIVVIGASAGGVTALRSLVSQLPPDLNAAIFIVIHLSPNRPSHLPEILSQCGPLPVHSPEDGEAIKPGHIYLARPDHHLLVEQGHIRLTRGAKVNRSRPAIDPLFRSAAVAYREQVVGMVLTGVLNDGTAGLAAIKAMGGITIVQDPEEAQFPDMPRSAIASGAVDYCLPLTGIAQLLANQEQLDAKQPLAGQRQEAIEIEAQIALKGTSDIATLNKIGMPSVYTCPECHGVLWQIDDPALLRYRCHTGHAYSARELLVDQIAVKQEELWAMLRSLKEIEHLSNQLQEASGEQDPEVDVADFRQIAERTKAHIDEIRRVLLRENVPEASAIRQKRDDDQTGGD